MQVLQVVFQCHYGAGKQTFGLHWLGELASTGRVFLLLVSIIALSLSSLPLRGEGRAEL